MVTSVRVLKLRKVPSWLFVAIERSRGLEDREVFVLRMLARGMGVRPPVKGGVL